MGAQQGHSGADGDGALLGLYAHQPITTIPAWFVEPGGQFTNYDFSFGHLGFIKTTGAINDEGEWKFFIRKNTANVVFRYFGLASPSSGQISIYKDGVLLLSGVTFYQASPAIVTGELSFSQSSDAVVTIKFTVPTKLESSSGYDCGLAWFEIRYP